MQGLDGDYAKGDASEQLLVELLYPYRRTQRMTRLIYGPSFWSYKWAGYWRDEQEEIIEEHEVLQAELLQVLCTWEANKVFFKVRKKEHRTNYI